MAVKPAHTGRSPSSEAGKRQLRQLSRLESRQVRLIVSMPALLMLYTVLFAFIIRFNVIQIAETLPSAEAQKEAEALADFVLLVGMASAVVAGGIGFILAWQIVRPLRELLANMRTVMAGDLPPEKLNLTTHIGEIGQLGSTFNQMVTHLREIFDRRDRQMRETTAGVILPLDREGTVLVADEEVGKLFGVKLGSVIGKRLDRVVATASREEDPELSEVLRGQVVDAIEGRPSVTSIEILLRSRPQPTLFSFSFQPAASTNPKGPACLVDIRDLSSMREFFVQMQRADRLAALGTLAAGIAHEIRNPLASIRGMAQLLNEDLRVAAEQNSVDLEYLRRIQTEIDRLDRIVASIMDFASIREGNAVAVDVNEMIRETVETCRPSVQKADEASLRLEWRLDRRIPRIPLEPGRFRQALLNLIRNALEAVHEEGGVVRFETRYLEQTNVRPILLIISNTGYIAPERRERIFEPFYTTKEDGSGLGLPIAYQIVIASNGELKLVCEQDMVHFHIYLPLQGQAARIPRIKGQSSAHILKLPSGQVRKSATISVSGTA